MELAGVAVVTGGAGGIGRAMGERFARAGMRVVLADVENAGEVRRIHYHGEDQQAERGVLGSQPFRGFQAVVVVPLRADASKADVDQCGVRPEARLIAR